MVNCLKTETWRGISALLELTGHSPAKLSASGTLGCGGGSEQPGTGVTLGTPDGELLTAKHNKIKFYSQKGGCATSVYPENGGAF